MSKFDFKEHYIPTINCKVPQTTHLKSMTIVLRKLNPFSANAIDEG